MPLLLDAWHFIEAIMGVILRMCRYGGHWVWVNAMFYIIIILRMLMCDVITHIGLMVLCIYCPVNLSTESERKC